MEHYVLTHYDLAMMAYLLQADMGTRAPVILPAQAVPNDYTTTWLPSVGQHLTQRIAERHTSATHPVPMIRRTSGWAVHFVQPCAIIHQHLANCVTAKI